MSTKFEATVDDLYHVPENGKAEIGGGIAFPDAATIYRRGEKPSRPCRAGPCRSAICLFELPWIRHWVPFTPPEVAE